MEDELFGEMDKKENNNKSTKYSSINKLPRFIPSPNKNKLLKKIGKR